MFKEIVADLYNDEEYIPVTSPLPMLHSYFAEPIELPLCDMPGGEIDAADVKARYMDARVKLIIMVKDWEKSGNGFGQRPKDDEEYGRFSKEHPGLQEGDNRQSFMRPENGQKEHHLYFWHLADEYGILSNVLTVLSGAVAADGDSVRTDCSSARKKRKKQVEGPTEFQHSITASLANMAVCAKEHILLQLQASYEDYAVKEVMAEESDYATPAKVKLFRELKEGKLIQIKAMNSEVRRMKLGLPDGPDFPEATSTVPASVNTASPRTPSSSVTNPRTPGSSIA